MKDQKVEWSDAFDAVEDGIVIIDIKYNILRVNKVFVRREMKIEGAGWEIKEHRRGYRRGGR